MNEKLKEPRIYLCAAIFVMLFLPWASVEVTADVMGFSGDSSNAMSGLQILQSLLIPTILVYLLPCAMLVVEFLPNAFVKAKISYLIASILGIILSIITLFMAKNIGSTSVDFGIASAESHIAPKLGFWLTTALFAAILILTLIRDFALSKEAIQEKGLKGVISEVAGNVSGELSDSVSAINLGAKCPNCGAGVTAGKKFCLKCGAKLPEIPTSATAESVAVPANASVARSSSRPAPSRKKVISNEPMTVKNYLASLDSVSCDKCGSSVPADKKFCPDCGEKLVIKTTLDKCDKCHAPLIGDKKFCPDCGAPVTKQELIANCKKCNAELFLGKKYCVSCGTKVGEVG